MLLLKGVAGVAQVASVVTSDPDPNKVVSPVVAGAVNIAAAAPKEPSVKRFVYTSSSTAITFPKPGIAFDLTVDQWNNEDIEAAWKPPPYEPDRAWAVYGASKTQAEQKLWEFYKESKPNFVLSTILPNANFGQIFSSQQPASTGVWVKEVFKGNMENLKGIPPRRSLLS